MGLRINTNIQSLTAQRQLDKSRENLGHTQDKLSTGSRIIKAMDDAAGLAISESLRATIRATGQNVKNAQDGFYLLQTADGALHEITNIIIRMKELAVQASSDTNGDKERGYLDNEYQALKLELNRISASTIFNGRPLLSGEGGEIQIQVGPNNVEQVDRILVSANFKVDLDELGLSDFAIGTAEGARESLEPIGFALDKIGAVRGEIGAGESRLNSTINSLGVYQENVSRAQSQIRDADIAKQTSELAKYNILTQAGVSVLAQANQIPALALKLLG